MVPLGFIIDYLSECPTFADCIQLYMIELVREAVPTCN